MQQQVQPQKTLVQAWFLDFSDYQYELYRDLFVTFNNYLQQYYRDLSPKKILLPFTSTSIRNVDDILNKFQIPIDLLTSKNLDEILSFFQSSHQASNRMKNQKIEYPLCPAWFMDCNPFENHRSYRYGFANLWKTMPSFFKPKTIIFLKKEHNVCFRNELIRFFNEIQLEIDFSIEFITTNNIDDITKFFQSDYQRLNNITL